MSVRAQAGKEDRRTSGEGQDSPLKPLPPSRAAGCAPRAPRVCGSALKMNGACSGRRFPGAAAESLGRKWARPARGERWPRGAGRWDLRGGFLLGG